MRISDCSSDVCSSDLIGIVDHNLRQDFTISACRLHAIFCKTPHGRDFRTRIGCRHDERWQIQPKRQSFCESDRRPSADCNGARSEEHTSELPSLMRISYAVYCLKKKKSKLTTTRQHK